MQAQEQRTTTINILIYHDCMHALLFQELGVALLKKFASLVDDVFA